MNLCVGQLPQQEIAQAHLAAGAYYQIWIGQVFGVEMPGYCFFVDSQMLNAAVPGGRVYHCLKASTSSVRAL